MNIRRKMACLSFKTDQLSIPIKFMVRKHHYLYSILQSFRKWYKNDYYKLMLGYYSGSDEFAVFLVEHKGDKYSDQVIYDIRRGMVNESHINESIVGFFGYVRPVFAALYIADMFNLTPVVQIGAKCCYYDSGMDHVTKNVFEYYYEPVSVVRPDEIEECSKVIRFQGQEQGLLVSSGHGVTNGYEIDQSEIERLAMAYKKYVRLNKTTRVFINRGVTNTLRGKKSLGVHVRGTDFNKGLLGHPYVISINDYLQSARNIFNEDDYEQVYLATDDANALEAFRNEFGDKLVYYKDTLRSSDNISVHNMEYVRPLHHYKLGLELLRDVYTLTSCDSLICGLSQVAFAAQYIKLAKDEQYNVLHIIDHGVKYM